MLRGLQAFGKIVETALDRAFVSAATALLIALLIPWLTALLPGLLTALLLTTLLLAIERLLAFANPLRDAIAREPIRCVLQLPRGTLLTLSLSSAHRARRLFNVLLQIVYGVRQRVFSFCQLLACLARVFILRVLTTTAREIFDVFRDLSLPRRSLRCTLAQVGNLLLAP